MKTFRTTLFILILTSIFIGCNESDTQNNSEQKNKICPQCYMPIGTEKLHTANIDKDGDFTHFDDIGCMILYTHNKKINLKKAKINTFTSDTKRFINPFQAYYKINEITPMMYGFSAYENKTDETMINFNEVTIKMLRGEHMANPKIRKQLLGY